MQSARGPRTSESFITVYNGTASRTLAFADVHKDEKRGFRRSSEAKLLPIEDERAEYKEAHRAAKKVVTKSHPGRMYTRRGELNKQESSDQLIESAEGLDC